ncbi:hypothetical protein [Staphylococcus epidermidis]|uniref:hypothetical protein n=1 Tax=Staphylococcus epidermidis TaxID=1282 RepID=UPI0016426C56|nr:hypothetical protein [Staphylococcus epidermidis]
MENVGEEGENLGSCVRSKISKRGLVGGSGMGGIRGKVGFERLVGVDSGKGKVEGLGY